MAFRLKLRGAAKEVFAVIFGFWQSKKAPVAVPNKIIHSITGLSHAAIVKAKNVLIAQNLIIAHEIRGKPSFYEVVLPDNLSTSWTRPKSPSKPSTKKTGLDSTPQKLKTYKVEKKNGNKSIAVGAQAEFTEPDQI